VRDKVTANKYAKAVIDTVKTNDEMEKLGAELSLFASAFEQTMDMRKALLHPGIPAETKEKIVAKVSEKLGLSDKCARAVRVILNRGRINLIGEIAESFAELVDEKLERIKVKVTSAFPLSEEELKNLKNVFSGITGKEAWLETNVDKSLIGGLVAGVGSMVYDGSVSNQLRLMKVKLGQEA